MSEGTSASALLAEGLKQHHAGQFDEANRLYEEALKIDPDNADALQLSGLLALHKGDPTAALERLDRAIALDGDIAKYHSNRGVALMALGKLDEAEAAYRAAMERDDTEDADYAYNLGDALARQGKTQQAVQALTRAIDQDENFAEAYFNRGRLYQTLGDKEAAIADYRTAAEIKPDFTEANNNLGLLLRQSGDAEGGLKVMRQAAKADTDNAAAQYNLGRSLLLEGLGEEALEAFREAVALDPDHPLFTAALVEAQFNLCAWDGLTAIAQRLADQTEKALNADAVPGETPDLALTVTADAHRTRRVAEAWANDATRQVGEVEPFDFKGRDDKEGPVVTGFLFGPAAPQPTIDLVSALVGKLPSDRIQAICIAPDAVIDACAVSQGQSIRTDDLSDEAISAAVYGAEIDVLVDLSGAGPRAMTSVMARKSAPVQAQWLGFQGSTGAKFIDYAISDPATVSGILANAYTEKLCWLPGSFAFVPEHPVTTSDRTKFGLPSDAMVFAALQSGRCVDYPSMKLWGEILKDVPGSVLWLLGGDNAKKAHLRRSAQMTGLDPDRVIFADDLDAVSRSEMLSVADVALETLFYNDWALTLDALRAGIPVLAMVGDDASSRTTASLLKAAGLSHLTATTKSAYRERALEIAGSPDRLTALKTQIAQLRDARHAPFDGDAFADGFTRALEAIWEHYQSGRQPKAIDIQDTET